MIVCDQCFSDSMLQGKVRNLSTSKGLCPVCGAEGAFLYDTRTNKELAQSFENIIDIYRVAPENHDSALLLADELCLNWDIFSNKSRHAIHEILSELCNETLQQHPGLLDRPVYIPLKSDDEFLKEHALVRTNPPLWADFENEIKNKNRYHSKLLNLDVLEKLCSYIVKGYVAGTKFYRSRICDNDKGFEMKDMSAPLAGSSSAGRANAMGITCLYVSGDMDATLHEIRAGEHDYVTVGTFELQRDIMVVDLPKMTGISPFVDDGLHPAEFIINKPLIADFDKALGKVVRRSDSPLDYVPTQYITDFIKSLGHDGCQEYDGIEYNSALNGIGFNLALFDSSVAKCVSVQTFEIGKVDYFIKSMEK